MTIGTAVSATSFNAALKEIYPVDRIEQEILDGADDPFVKSWNRIEDGGGYQWRLPVATSTNVRVGASFANAQSTNSNTKNQAFLITYNQIYSLASWSGPVLQASMGDKNTFESVVTQEMELAIAALNNKIATQAYRTGTGSITQVSASASVSTSAFVLQLQNNTDVLLFEVGDIVVFSASTADGGTLRTGTATITGIDLGSGTLTNSTTWSSSITSLGTGDYIYRCSGDASNNSTANVLQGFQAWCPASTASLTVSFFGVTRSSYQAKLAGLFYDNSSLQDSVAEALVNGMSLFQAAGARKKLDLIVLHPNEMKRLVNDTSTKVVVGGAKIDPSSAKVGLSGFSLLTDFGPVPIEQSIFQVPGYASCISTSTWHLMTSGKPGVQEVDGIMALRVSTDDAYEARLAAVNIALGCSAPGWNGIVKF